MTTNNTPANAAAHARAWFNKSNPKNQLPERGNVPTQVLIEWTLAGMPLDDAVSNKRVIRKSTGPKFETGELKLFRAWCDENGKDSNDDSVRAEWFDKGKPQPQNYGDDAIAAIITARKINKDGTLSKAKTVEFYVKRGELNAVRGEGARGKSPAIHYVQAIADQLEGFAPVRIATRNAKGDDSSTFHANIEQFDDGAERTVEGWTQEGGKSLRQQKIEADQEKERLAAERDAMAAQIAEMKAQLDALTAQQQQ